MPRFIHSRYLLTPLAVLLLLAGTHRAHAASEDSSVMDLIEGSSWAQVLFLAFLIVVLSGLLAFLIYLRLKKNLDTQTRALRTSEERLRHLFDNSPVAIVEADFSAVVKWLDDLRKAEVTDLRTHLAQWPGLAAEKLKLVTVLGANRTVLRLTDSPDLETYVSRIRNSTHSARVAAFYEQITALWQGALETSRELRTRGFDDQPGHSLMHWSVPLEGGQPDYRRVQVAFTDLGVLRATEERLREVEDRWHLALIGLNVGIWEVNYSTDEVFISDRWKEILGFGPQELPNPRAEFWKRIHGEDTDRVKLALRDYLDKRSPHYRVEFRMLTKDGRFIWIRSQAQALFDAQGHPVRVVGAHTDIDERKRAEQALSTSEERYRVLFENAPLPILEYDLRGLRAWLEGLRVGGVQDIDGYLDNHPEFLAGPLAGAQVVGVNKEALNFVGVRSKEEALQNLSRFFTPELQTLRRELCRAIWEQRQAIEGEIVLKAFDGSLRRAFYRWWVPSLGGVPSFAWTQVVLVDLTGIKRTEEALAAERERLSVTLRSMAESVITTDTEGRVLFLNEAARQLTGWLDNAGIGRRLEEVCVLRHALTRTPLADPVQTALKEYLVHELPAHTNLIDRHGALRLVEGRCAPIQDQHSRPFGTVLVVRDVTERARLEDEIQRASKLESVGILAGGIAHDFNNLLTVVMGNITLATLDTQAMATAGRWLAEAERGVLRARDLTQQLLTFARGGEPVRTAVRLPEVVRESAGFVLHGAKVRCDFNLPEDLWTAEVDKGQIGQVVQNLVINATQAMPEGGVIAITMRNEQLLAGGSRPLKAGSYLCIEITDTGAGIKPEHLGRIFDPYFTTKSSGNGLGLATVYSIIRKHQGHIEVESELERGTTFRFWLPAVPHRKPVENEPTTALTPSHGRVLFMDDEEPIRLTAQALLRRLGLDVVTVNDGAQAVRAYAEALKTGQRFDVVVMDLTVPGAMGGKEAMVELRKMDPQARGIVSSGYSSDPVMANFRAYGFSGMVPKPYKLTDFAKTIRRVIEGDLEV